MIKNLTKHGNSLALVIDKDILDILEINEQTPLHITTDGQCLVISPVRDDEREKRFKDALAEGNEKYAVVYCVAINQKKPTGLWICRYAA